MSFNLAPNASLGSAITTIDKLQKSMNMPASLQADFQGTAASFRNSLSNEPLLILAALVTVYIVLGVLYESFIHPITILSTLPSAGVGAFLALILFHQDLSVVAIIGIVLLIGIVKKNGIMMVDFALEAERRARQELHRRDLRGVPAALPADHDDDDGGAAGRHSAGVRHRHRIGAAPAAGHRDGRRPAVSQVLTLYTTPVIYIFFDNLAHRFSRKPATAVATASEPQAGGAAVNISAPFIHRPVATTLLTVAIAIAGAIAFQVLPVSPLPQVDFPTISVRREPAGRQRGDHGVVGGDAAGAAVRAHRRRDGDDVVERPGHDRHHDSVRSEPQHRRRGARCGSGDQCGAHVSAGESSRQSDLSQGESGGRADHDPRAYVRHVRAGQALRRSLDGHGAEDLADPGRGAGERGRRRAAFGARGGESDQAGELRPDDGESAVGAEPAELRTWRAGRSPTAT